MQGLDGGIVGNWPMIGGYSPAKWQREGSYKSDPDLERWGWVNGGG